MAHHFVTSADIPVDGERLVNSKVESAKRAAGGVALLTGLISAYLLFIAPEKIQAPFAYSWLFAFFFFFTLAVGGLLLDPPPQRLQLGVGDLGAPRDGESRLGLPVDGDLRDSARLPDGPALLYEWMNIHRDAMEAGGKVSTAACALFSVLRQPVDGEGAATADHQRCSYNKQWYMNQFAWYVRFAFYFVGLGLVIRTCASSPPPRTRIRTRVPKSLFKARFHSTYTLIIFAITITFAGIDLLKG